jgi:hypothetical protein
MANQEIKTRTAYRQGELLFIPFDREDTATIDFSMKTDPYWKKLNTNVLREGEATGHKHEVITETPNAISILAPVNQFIRGLANMANIGSDDRVLVATEPAEIIHPEHNTLALPKGNYLVIVQREYDEVKARRILD